MTLRHIVLVNQSSANIPFVEVDSVARALQIQIDRDFALVWGRRAQIIAQHPNTPIPPSAWPIRIVDHPVGGLGIHLNSHHKPFAQVMPTSDWSITASHELLEMLIDPYGQKFVKAPDIAPGSDGHLVSYLVEVGDPCETFAYSINGVAVSDFVTQEYYNPNASAGETLDFLTQLQTPYEVPPGCYISWIDPEDNRWHQKTPEGAFTRSSTTFDPKANPRDDRDHKLPSEEGDRHDLSRIRSLLRY